MLATCSGCQAHKQLPHSCGHRACPHCQHHDSTLWLQRQLKAALHAVGLVLPAHLPVQWVVDCTAVGDGQEALQYLGRYLYRGVISERDILRCSDGQVTYRWRDANSGKTASRTLAAEDFLWLLLQHVLPKGLQRARNFGVLHHNARSTLALVQLTQATPCTTNTDPPTRPVWRCACGQPMVILRRRMRPPSSGTSWTAPQTRQPDKPNPMQHATH